MEVHIGKCSTSNFECGLCEANFDTMENLETNLKNCEIYKCSVCEIRLKLLMDMKSHIRNEHNESIQLLHLKIDRENPIKIVDLKKYKTDEV